MPQHTSQQTSMTTANSGRAYWLVARAHASLRRPDFSQRNALSAVTRVLWAGSAGLLIWIGAIHWVLWHEGYKYIPTIGPFFLVDAIAAVVLAVVFLIWPRAIVGIASAGFVALTIAALWISLWIGLFGFHESLSASHVVQALWIESITVVLLVTWSLIALAAVPGEQA